MKKLVVLAFLTSIMAAPVAAIAQEKKSGGSGNVVTDTAKKVGDAAVDTVKTHPGKSAGVVACGIIVAFFPPALLACGAALVGGVGVDVAKDNL